MIVRMERRRWAGARLTATAAALRRLPIRATFAYVPSLTFELLANLVCRTMIVSGLRIFHAHPALYWATPRVKCRSRGAAGSAALAKL